MSLAAIRSAGRRLVATLELVTDNSRMFAEDARRAPIALGKPSAELVNRGNWIDANRDRVLADVGTCHQALGPVRKIVALEAGEEIDGNPGRFSNRVERDLTLHTNASKIRTKGVAAHGPEVFAKPLPAPSHVEARPNVMNFRRQRPNISQAITF